MEPDDLLNLIVEVSGAGRRDKAAKVATTRTMWVPAVNGTGAFGRWDYIEVRDPWDAKALIRKHLAVIPARKARRNEVGHATTTTSNLTSRSRGNAAPGQAGQHPDDRAS